MLRTVRTLAILFALPPLVVITLAHLVPTRTPEWVWYATLPTLAFMAIAGIATSKWSQPVQVIVGVLYVVAAIPLLPLLAIFAVCTTADCL